MSAQRTLRYTMQIEAQYEESGGYMANANMEDFLEWAQNETRHLQVMIRRGSTPPKAIPAKITVTAITQELR